MQFTSLQDTLRDPTRLLEHAMAHCVPRRLNIDEFTIINRRRLLRSLGAGALLTAGSGLFSRSVWSQPAFASNPFTLGVASGDPAPDGFVLWTKIAPKPLERGAGMPGKAVEVDWIVASDEGMKQVVQKGKAIAHPEMGHAVHVEVTGLEPACDYFYQFVIGGERSAVGRSRTFPRAGAAVVQLRFGVAGCQRYEAGLFTAYRHLAAERFDFVFHYGDYIYEYPTLRLSAKSPWPVIRVMPGEPDETYVAPAPPAAPASWRAVPRRWSQAAPCWAKPRNAGYTTASNRRPRAGRCWRSKSPSCARIVIPIRPSLGQAWTNGTAR
jgi:PhoD-like phosphatase, N-terminal domain/PhoD-like phosphatase